MPGLSLSVCLIVKNEAASLGACLDSVRDVADEIIVVDTGSTDKTREIAAAHGAKVFETPWVHDFARARNVSLGHATQPWILVLDADETLTAEGAKVLRDLLPAHTIDGQATTAFSIMVNCSTDGGRTGMLAGIVRLFPNRPDVRYEWPIHEQVMTSLARAGVLVRESGVMVLHAGYVGGAVNQAKQRRNLAILSAQVDEGRELYPHTFFLLGGAHLDLGEYEAAAAAYDECLHRASPQTDIAIGARVRLGTALMKLGRIEAAVAAMAGEPRADWHPEQLTQRGQCELALGNAEGARACFELALGCAPRAYVPACYLHLVKADALAGLAEYWKRRGQMPLAVEFLRAAVASKQHGTDFTPEDLRARYAAHQ